MDIYFIYSKIVARNGFLRNIATLQKVTKH